LVDLSDENINICVLTEKLEKVIKNTLLTAIVSRFLFFLQQTFARETKI